MRETIDRAKTQAMFESLTNEYNAAVERSEGDEYMNALVMLISGIFVAQDSREDTLRIAMAFTRALLHATKELRELRENEEQTAETAVESKANITGSFEA